MMKIGKTVLVLAAVIISTLSVSCSGKKSENNFSSQKLNIGLSIDTLIIERWQQDCNVFTEAAKAYGATVTVKDASNDVVRQITQINELIEQKVDALVIVSKEADSLTEVVQRAKARNIPVISYDRLIRNSDVTLYVTVDCEKVGTLMAKSMLDLVPEGNYWCIYGSEADYNMTLVDTGVKKMLWDTDINVDVKYFTPDWNYDLSYRKMNSLLNEGKVPSAVICGNDAIAETVIRSISEHKLGNSIPVVGQDADLLACRRIASGVQAATVYKPITELAKKAAECACLLGSGTKVQALEGVSAHIDNGVKKVPSIFLEPVLVKEENLSEVIVKSGFHKAAEIYK